MVSLSWLVYFVVVGWGNEESSWKGITVTISLVCAIVSSVLYLTHTDCYRSYVMPVSMVVATTLCVLSLVFLIFVPPDTDGLTLVGHFTLCTEILLLIYTVVPMPLYACIGISVTYSFIFECLAAYLYGTERFVINSIADYSLIGNLSSDIPSGENHTNTDDPHRNEDIGFSTTLIIRILMHVCIHLIGIHILIMTYVRMRGTFMKVGQSLLVRRQLEMEKQLKEKMILSVMPPKVAEWLMAESEKEREREDSLKKGSIPSNNPDFRYLLYTIS